MSDFAVSPFQLKLLLSCEACSNVRACMCACVLMNENVVAALLFAKDRYLFNNAVPLFNASLANDFENVSIWTVFLFLYRKAASLVLMDQILLLSWLILMCFMVFPLVPYHIYIFQISHCRFWYFRIIFLFVSYFLFLFYFLHKLWKQFCTLILREYLESEEATVFHCSWNKTVAP